MKFIIYTADGTKRGTIEAPNVRQARLFMRRLYGKSAFLVGKATMPTP